MNQHESRIRDYLCQHLDLIEPGMQLVQKEFKLRSGMGAGGSIDILAKDIFGHLVVIEIKRSDQAARAALHELTKYVALLKSSQGIQSERIRALLLSTEWHELAVPFSEYLKSVEVATDGFMLDADEDGLVSCVRHFEPLVLAHPLRLERSQDIFFFEQAAQRDSAVEHLADAAGKAHISDFVVLSVDYKGKKANVIYPHAAYFVFSSPISHDNPEELDGFIRDTGMEWEQLEEPSENFLCWLGEFASFEHSDLEIGYPEKLASMITEGWNARVAHRAGRYATNAEVLTDTALIADAMRVEGGAAYYLYRTASPKFKPSWAAFKSDLAHVVLGCSTWENILGDVMAKIESDRPLATISANIYNPADLVVALTKAFGAKDYRFFSSFQLVESSSERVCVYVGTLVWSGQVMETLGNEFLNEVFGGPDTYLMARHMGQQHEYYDAACAAIGLESVVFEVLNPGSPAETVRLLHGSAKSTSNDRPYSSVGDFISANQFFGASLVKEMKSFVVGLV